MTVDRLDYSEHIAIQRMKEKERNCPTGLKAITCRRVEVDADRPIFFTFATLRSPSNLVVAWLCSF